MRGQANGTCEACGEACNNTAPNANVLDPAGISISINIISFVRQRQAWPDHDSLA